MRPFILVGDKTTHRGTVITGASVSTIEGKQMARMGDKVACPVKGHGICTIISGDPTFLIEGAPAARAGDKTSCGAVLIPSQVKAGEETFTGSFPPLQYSLGNQDKPQADKEILELYFVNENGIKVSDLFVGQCVLLLIKTKNLIGETINISLNSEKVDFKYKDKILHNDTIENFYISSDQCSLALEVLAPEGSII